MNLNSLSHYVVSSTLRHERVELMLVMIDTDSLVHVVVNQSLK